MFRTIGQYQLNMLCEFTLRDWAWIRCQWVLCRSYHCKRNIHQRFSDDSGGRQWQKTNNTHRGSSIQNGLESSAKSFYVHMKRYCRELLTKTL
ncbi:Uncharacterised protein [Klebsiella michiganensis]|uniref:Uncharacterized protein n=1 Tax=Klebsiella michiganensis TaxID=1134687 RepID=A0A7H4MZJ1_9ENTR|nr:Uncharacterised protein [Klebsiella michiganensis]